MPSFDDVINHADIRGCSFSVKFDPDKDIQHKRKPKTIREQKIYEQKIYEQTIPEKLIQDKSGFSQYMKNRDKEKAGADTYTETQNASAIRLKKAKEEVAKAHDVEVKAKGLLKDYNTLPLKSALRSQLQERLDGMIQTANALKNENESPARAESYASALKQIQNSINNLMNTIRNKSAIQKPVVYSPKNRPSAGRRTYRSGNPSRY